MSQTVERKIDLRLSLPPSFANCNLKSLNVKLVPNVPPPPPRPNNFDRSDSYGKNHLAGSPEVVPSSVASYAEPVPSSVISTSGLTSNLFDDSNNNTEAQYESCQYQQQDHLLNNVNQRVLPPTVLSSQDHMANSTTNYFHPRPETVSSCCSPSPNSDITANHSNTDSKKRCRPSRHDQAAPNHSLAASSSSSSSSSANQQSTRMKRRQAARWTQ